MIFPSEVFDEILNGDLNDTVLRVLNKFVGVKNSIHKIEYLGSYIRKIDDHIEVCYNYNFNDFKGDIFTKNYRWVDDDVLENHEKHDFQMDQNTKIFLDVNGI
jgi:hypothetical protein